MARDFIVRKFETLRLGQSGKVTAPHKPLLILYALGELLQGKRRLLPYKEVDGHLGYLLSEFASERSGENTHLPFWRLQNDGIWEVSDADKIGLTGRNDPYKGDLISLDASGGFTVEVFNQFRTDTEFAFKIAQMMLDRHFSEQLHAKVLYLTWVDCKGSRAI